MTDLLDSLWNTIESWFGTTFGSILESILNATIFKLLYYIEWALCKIIGILGEMFSVFAGLTRASYDDKPQYLISIFFSNKAVSNIYLAMALVGMALTIGFTIWGVVRKMFDASGKVQQSMGQILTGAVRSIVLIAGLTLIMSVVITGTNKLMQVVDDIFNNAYNLDKEEYREFTEEEYAAMGRVLATIGNYSLVPSSNNRYNLNICFNDIRSDMQWLQDQGVFAYTYYEEDKTGKQIPSWQSVLSQIAKSNDLRRDVKVDRYNESVVSSLTAAIEYLKNTQKVTPVDHAEMKFTQTEKVHLDRMVFLMGTMHAARTSYYNDSPALDDPLRGPYYFAKGRNIYNLDHVNQDFNIGFPTDYLVVYIMSIALIFDLAVIILNCIARIFNLLFLYIIAPPVIAASPMDNGGKFKQWTIAFIVQSLSVFGTVISMRLVLIFIPIVLSPKFVLFDPKEQALLNEFAKFILIYGALETAKKATSLFTGILADSAGWQSIQAGDMSSSAAKAIGTAKAIGGKAFGAAKAVGGFALSPATNLAKRPFAAAGHWWKNLGSGNAQRRNEKAVDDEEMREKIREERKAKREGNKPDEKKETPPNKKDDNRRTLPTQRQSTPPPLPQRWNAGTSHEAPSAPSGGRQLDNRRQQYGMGPNAQDRPVPQRRQRDDSTLPTNNRPHL